MKKFSPTLFLLFLSLCIYGQSPEKMSYQAVIRDASNTLVTNQSIGMQISILQTTITGTTVYAETHTVTTNLNGLVSLEIGTGSTSDTFSTIDWSAGPYFIKTETDPTGGSSYTITGTSQLMSVPFAMYAKSSGNGITTDQSDAIAANTDKVGYTEALVSANTDVVANTAKTGITTDQSGAIVANTAKEGYTEALVSANTDVAANTLKVGYTDALVSANTAVAANSAKVGYTEALVSANTAVAANTAKVGYTEAAVSANTDVAANTSKVGYTDALVSANTDVAANTAKVGYTEAAVSANTDVTANTAKVGYTEALVSANTDVVANTLKVGYTDALVSANTDVTANTAKVGYTDALVSANTDVVANTAKTGITTGQSDAIVANTANRLTNTNLITALDARIAALEVLLPAEIGDFRSGGVVFWVDPSDNTHGLVCAIQDQSSGIRWYNGSYSTTGATGTAVGTGSTNTTTIITEQGATATSYAAGLARAYTAGGYTDWFLPSKDELNQMYLKKTDINTTALANGGVIFTNFYYWSSTEDGNYNAWSQSFDSGYQDNSVKTYTDIVRAVRAF